MKGTQGVVLAEAQGQEIGGGVKGPSTAHTAAVGTHGIDLIKSHP